MSFEESGVTNNVANLTWVMENETNSKLVCDQAFGDDGEYDSIGVVAGLNNMYDHLYLRR